MAGDGNWGGYGYPAAAPAAVGAPAAGVPAAAAQRRRPPGSVRAAVVIMFVFGGLLLLVGTFALIFTVSHPNLGNVLSVLFTMVPALAMLAAAVPVRRGRRVAWMVTLAVAALNIVGVLLGAGDSFNSILDNHHDAKMAFTQALRLALGPMVTFAIGGGPSVAVIALLLWSTARRFVAPTA